MESQNRTLSIVIGLLVIAGLAAYYVSKIQTQTLNNTEVKTTSTVVIVYNESDRLAFEEYLRENISFLSPEKEVLGGKFYVTGVRWINGNEADVSYEDGHIALTAKAGFSYDENNKISVDYFTVNPEGVPTAEEREIITQ